MLPLVLRLARGLSGWLVPAYGSELHFVPDLDDVEALAPEREALWKRIGAAEFLSDDEKREAVGFGDDAEEAGERAAGHFAKRYNSSQLRVPSGNGRESGRWAGETGTQNEPGTRVAQNSPRGGSGRGRGDRTMSDATPGQQIRLSTSENRANEAVRRVQELDPTWRPSRSMSEGAEGRIAENIAKAREAEARLAELLSRGFGNYESYAQFGNTLRQGFARAGYTDTVPMIRGSSVTGESFRTGRPFDSNPAKPSDYDLALASPSMMQRAIELGVRTRGGGTRTGPLSEPQLRDLGLHDAWLRANDMAGRPTSFMSYGSVDAIIRRGPSRSIPSK